MKLIIGADHAGYEMKEAIKSWLMSLGHEVEDVGAHEYDDKDDYPDFIIPMAKQIGNAHATEVPDTYGIFFAGSGQGESMAANSIKGVRAAVYYGGNIDIVRLSKEHNNANILSLGARFMSEDEAKQAIELWLSTSFSGDERHVRRLAKIDQYHNDV